MKCYKCGSFLYEGEYCNNCGADVSVYRQIVLRSNELYNGALQCAKDRNLSKAAEYLNLSLKMFKGNVNSHNLLGLVYFEMGDYAEGIAHWVISKNLQPENNLASVFLDEIQNDKSAVESLNSNVRKYNKALSYVDQQNYDLAEIQLKKLLNDENVHMVKAFQLLALLRIRKKKYTAAGKAVKRAESIDAGSELTIAYKNFISSQIRDEEKNLTAAELKAKRANDRAEEEQRQPLSGDDVIIPRTSYREANPTAVAILQTLVGFVVGAAIVFFIVLPAKTNSLREEVNSVRTEYQAVISDLQSQAKEQTDAEQGSEAETVSADVSIPKTSTEEEAELKEAYEFYLNGDRESCAETLSQIADPDKLSDLGRTVYDSLSPVMDSLPDIWYEQAMAYFEANDFENALKKFTEVYNVQNTTGEALYYMALCNYDMGINDKAAELFNEYMSSYPDGDHYQECAYLLGMMN